MKRICPLGCAHADHYYPQQSSRGRAVVGSAKAGLAAGLMGYNYEDRHGEAIARRLHPAAFARRPHDDYRAEQAQATLLGRAVQPLQAGHPGVSGSHPLDHALAAFAARMLLARNAERTIDIQYSIWQNDITGTMLPVEWLL